MRPGIIYNLFRFILTIIGIRKKGIIIKKKIIIILILRVFLITNTSNLLIFI